MAAIESGDEAKRAATEDVIRLRYAPVVDVHWVTVKQLAYLEPTLVETVACMIGHTQVALANSLQGDNPFSDACLIAMDYGREKIIKDDWKSIFYDAELDGVLNRMLDLEKIDR